MLEKQKHLVMVNPLEWYWCRGVGNRDNRRPGTRVYGEDDETTADETTADETTADETTADETEEFKNIPEGYSNYY